MKKVLSVFVVIALLISALALTGCSSGDQDERLVGRWNWVNSEFTFIRFNEDGTGTRNWNGTQTFRWSTNGDRLNINLDESPGRRYIQNERWNFTIDGDRVVFDSRQTNDRWTYVRN